MNFRLDPQTLSECYQIFREPLIRWLIHKYHFDSEVATDLYQEAFVVLIDQLINEENLSFKTGTNVKTYLFSIAKNKAREYKRYTQKVTAVTETPPYLDEAEEEEARQNWEEDTERALLAFKRLGEKCRELLYQAIVNKMPMEAIAEDLGYQNANTAKNMKYKCLKKLREFYNNLK